MAAFAAVAVLHHLVEAVFHAGQDFGGEVPEAAADLGAAGDDGHAVGFEDADDAGDDSDVEVGAFELGSLFDVQLEGAHLAVGFELQPWQVGQASIVEDGAERGAVFLVGGGVDLGIVEGADGALPRKTPQWPSLSQSAQASTGRPARARAARTPATPSSRRAVGAGAKRRAGRVLTPSGFSVENGACRSEPLRSRPCRLRRSPLRRASSRLAG